MISPGHEGFEKWGRRMLAMRICMAKVQSSSVLPLARLGDQEVAENLDFLGGFQLFRINEVDRQGRQLRFTQYWHEVGFLLGEIVRNEADADAGPDRVLEGDDVVGDEYGLARRSAIKAGGF